MPLPLSLPVVDGHDATAKTAKIKACENPLLYRIWMERRISVYGKVYSEIMIPNVIVCWWEVIQTYYNVCFYTYNKYIFLYTFCIHTWKNLILTTILPQPCPVYWNQLIWIELFSRFIADGIHYRRMVILATNVGDDSFQRHLFFFYYFHFVLMIFYTRICINKLLCAILYTLTMSHFGGLIRLSAYVYVSYKNLVPECVLLSQIQIIVCYSVFKNIIISIW